MLPQRTLSTILVRVLGSLKLVVLSNIPQDDRGIKIVPEMCAYWRNADELFSGTSAFSSLPSTAHSIERHRFNQLSSNIGLQLAAGG